MKITTLILIVVLETVAFAQPSAEDLYSQGEEAFNRHDYATAIGKWQASYDLSHEPLLLFNLAHAYRLSGDCPRALKAYKRFVAADPLAQEHALAVQLSQEMEDKCGAPTPPATEQQPSPPNTSTRSAFASTTHEDRPARTGSALKISGMLLGGASVLTIATGLYLGHNAQSIGDEVTDACRVSCDWAAWKDRDAKGQRYATIGRGLVVGGAVGIAGSTVLYYLGIRQGSLTIEPSARGGGAAVSWSGSW